MPAASCGILACCGYKRPIPAGLNINTAGDYKNNQQPIDAEGITLLQPSMNKRTVAHSVVIIATFGVAFYGKQMLSGYLPISLSADYLKIAYTYLWWLLPTVLVAGFLYGFKNLFEHLGLTKGFTTGLLFSLVAVSPMFISSAVIGHIASDLKPLALFRKTLLAGFMEEYLFRGFLFGLLFRKAGWGFLPASLAGAFIFGLGHMYQGSSSGEAFGIFVMTALGAVWFAWLYVEWHNLWVPIFLHTFMNLSWILFEISDNALGGVYSNLFRAMTIALSITITVKYRRQSGLRINKSNLLTNTNPL
jgi:hypothetical protein